MKTKKQKEQEKKLLEWQEKLSSAENYYSKELCRMDERHDIYEGRRQMKRLSDKNKEENITCKNVQNVVFELIETEVSTAIPMPKVIPQDPLDANLAKLIEDMLRQEVTRLPMSELNDISERTGYIQGGTLYHIEWDNAGGFGKGDVIISGVHPKQIIPQHGVTSDISDMDYFFLKVPATKKSLEAKFDVKLSDETETEPEIRGKDSDVSHSTELLTQVICYYKNGKGGIGKFSWAGDTVLEDFTDYQARRALRCKKCNAPKAINMMPIAPLSETGELTEVGEPFMPEERSREDRCVFCGSSEWDYFESDYEEIYEGIENSFGLSIPGMQDVTEIIDGVEFTYSHPTRIPSYKPDCFPVILQKNIPLFGHLLGVSDVDIIEDSQEALNRMNDALIDKCLHAGTIVTLPPNARITAKPGGISEVRLSKLEEKEFFGVHNLLGNIAPELNMINAIYEQPRRTLGVTDSYQGRADATARSGKAKQISASQAAGRLESKRIAKNSAYKKIYECIFKFMLAYLDEPIDVMSRDVYGEESSNRFSRWDFLKKDDAGEYYWNDRFIFDIDSSEPLAANREAMWQETRQNFQSGTYGDPADPETLIMFWAKMERLMYPGAGETLRYLREKQEKAQAAAASQAAGPEANAMIPPPANGDMAEGVDVIH